MSRQSFIAEITIRDGFPTTILSKRVSDILTYEEACLIVADLQAMIDAEFSVEVPA
jgi:hypothetical protein